MITMKKYFWIRTGLLLIILIFAVLGGNFLYTGAENASSPDATADSIPLNSEQLLVQTFSPEHARVTAISLALQPPAPLTPQSLMSGLPASMSAESGDLTVILSDHAAGTEIYRSTVPLNGVSDGWYLAFPVNCRLDTGAQYDISIYAENYQDGMNPSIYLMSQTAPIPEITEGLTKLPRRADGAGTQTDDPSDTSAAQTGSSADTTGSADAPGAVAIRFTYDVLVPSRLAVFLTALVLILLYMAATALFSRKKSDKKAGEITLGKFLAVRIRRIPLIHILFFAAVTAAAVILRIAFFPVKSNDYYLCFESWISDMRSYGIWGSLGQDIGDYPPLYITPLTLLSLLPFEPAVIIKLMPCFFDFVLALTCVKLTGQFGVTALHKKLTLYAVILLNPLTLLDSAAWGQCDSLYSSFVLLTLLAICGARPWSPEAPADKKGRFWRSGDGICLLFAAAFSFKLQAVFFLPILCLLWILQKRNVLKPAQLLWIPIVYTISCIPMYLAGRSLKVMFKIYLGQANRNYGTLTLNYPNLYSLIGSWSENLYDSYFIYGMLLTFLLLIVLFYQLYCRKVKLESLLLCKVTSLSILTICFCLPLVHERYAYVAEMLLFVIMIKETKYVKAALTTMFCTLFTYCSYLLQMEQSFSVLPDQVIALLRLGVVVYLAGDIFQTGQQKKQRDIDPEKSLPEKRAQEQQIRSGKKRTKKIHGSDTNG